MQDMWNLLFNSFTFDIFIGVSGSSDSHVIFFNSIPKEQSKNFTINNITVKLKTSEKDVFLLLYLKTRSLNKKVESLKRLLDSKFFFWIQVICILNPEITESWCSADADNESIYWLPGYSSKHQFRNLGQTGGRGEFESFFTIL